ncbi:ribosome-associated translation inhibitor RaiA [Bdellovibrionota bacterium FG-1]
MNLNFNFKHIDASDSLREYCTTKSERLKKFFNGKIHVTWSLGQEKHNRIVHCHLLGNQMDYFGETSSEDFHEAIDLAIDKIEKQIRKHKEIVVDHKQKVREPSQTE